MNVYDTSAYSFTLCFTNELGLLSRILKIIQGDVKCSLNQNCIMACISAMKLMFAFKSKSESVSLYPGTQERSQLQNCV